jgi:hypothetical protein
MRTLVLASYLALLITQALAETIMPSDAPSHIGEHITVEGIVMEVHHAASGRATFLNMGGRYPNNVFTVFLWTTRRSSRELIYCKAKLSISLAQLRFTRKGLR